MVQHNDKDLYSRLRHDQGGLLSTYRLQLLQPEQVWKLHGRSTNRLDDLERALRRRPYRRCWTRLPRRYRQHLRPDIKQQYGGDLLSVW